uniref:SDE2 telomere maintenance homolog (S. pombe) n=1 Tax=Hippocampus comes TaxID=109280 RepID=A0A3Q2ZAR4_HIPCM
MEPTTEVFVCGPFASRFSACVFPQGSSVRDRRRHFQAPASARDFYVSRDGGVTGPDERLRGGAVYRLAPRLPGGKGGFGSMLRALGAQIEKTTNREACRDLSGRRLRDVNHEKEMGEWLKRQADREADKERRRAERLQRKMAEPKHQFSDPAYQRQCHSLAERLEDSVLKGRLPAFGFSKPKAVAAHATIGRGSGGLTWARRLGCGAAAPPPRTGPRATRPAACSPRPPARDLRTRVPRDDAEFTLAHPEFGPIYQGVCSWLARGPPRSWSA